MTRFSLLLLSLVIAALTASPALAQDADKKQAGPSLAELVKQLDAEDFADRNAASAKLAELGKEAIPALIEAAQSESAEASTRSFDILRKHYDAADAELKTAAKEALEKIAAAEGASGRRAGDILKPKPAAPVEPQATPFGARGIRIVPGGFAPGRVAIEFRAVAGGEGAKRITVKTIDGVKEVEAVEGGRTVKFSDDPAKGIKMKVFEKKDGKDEVKEYEAKNAEELKEKHPEAHKLYEQYSKLEGGIKIEAIAIGPGGLVPPPPAPVRPRAVVLRDPQEVTDRLDKVQAQLEETAAKLKKIVESAENAGEVKKAIEAIEASQKTLEEARAKLPK